MGGALSNFFQVYLPHIWWSPLYDGHHSMMVTTIWWSPQYNFHHYMMVTTVWWCPPYDGHHHMMVTTIWWSPPYDGHHHTMATTILWSPPYDGHHHRMVTPIWYLCCQDGRALLSSGHNRGVSDQTRKNIRIVFDALRANPRVTVQRLDGLLSQIPRRYLL